MNKTTNETQKPTTEDIQDTEPFYMVVRLDDAGYGELPSEVYNEQYKAFMEAARLAELNPSHSGGFAVLKAVAIYKADVKVNATILK